MLASPPRIVLSDKGSLKFEDSVNFASDSVRKKKRESEARSKWCVSDYLLMVGMSEIDISRLQQQPLDL